MSSNYRNTSERITLLHLQTRLNQEYCASCPFSNEPSNDNCEGCHVYTELKNIGDWLNEDTQQHKSPLLHESRRNKIRATRDDYILLKSKGLSDGEIAHNMNVSIPTLSKWKVKNDVHSKSHLEVMV